MPIKPSYLMLTGAGALVAVSGVKGWAIGKTTRDVLQGKNPSSNVQLTSQITPATYGYSATGTGGPSQNASGIAAIAESQIGFPYQWAGSPANGVADCSSWVNWCVGRLGRRSIPGFPNGSYTGRTHGPNTIAWLMWMGTGLSHVRLAQTQPGDLAIWQTHMGIIVGKGQMVSDLNPSLGTQQTAIKGLIPGEILVCARLTR